MHLHVTANTAGCQTATSYKCEWRSEEDLSVGWGCWTSCQQVRLACGPCPSSHIGSHLEPAGLLASHLYRNLPCPGPDLQHIHKGASVDICSALLNYYKE